MISVVFGGLGGGKTLFAVEQMARLRRAGCPVVSNIRVTIPGVELLEEVVRYDHKGHVVGGFWEDEARWKGYAIVIDEADYFFDTMDWGKFGPSFNRWLKSVRKNRQEVVLITQCFENLHVRIRRLAQRFILCDNTSRSNWLIRDGWLPMWLSRFYRVEFSANTLKESDVVQERWLSRAAARRLFGMYDTEQRV